MSLLSFRVCNIAITSFFVVCLHFTKPLCGVQRREMFLFILVSLATAAYFSSNYKCLIA